MPRRPLKRTTVQEELQQTKPFPTVAEEAGVALLRTAALLRRAIATRIDPHGLSPAQYNVLRILRGAGDDGLPTLAVRDRLVEEAPGITRLIDKLERAGHVRRDRTSRDRRTVKCRITPKGLSLLDEIDATLIARADLITTGLPELKEQAQLVELLEKVRAGLAIAGTREP